MAGETQVAIVMNYTGDANAVHELTHAYQGGIGQPQSMMITKDGVIFRGADPSAVNANAEVEAYEAQYGYDNSSMPSSRLGGTPQSMGTINAMYVSGIYDETKTPPVAVYPDVQKFVGNMVNTIFQQIRVF